MNVYLPEVRAWDAMMHEDLPQIELPAQQWVPITTTLSDEEMAAAAPTACNVCQAWVNNETDTLVRLTCNSEGCQATFHGGDEGCLQEWFNKTQHVDPTCPLCRRPVERRFLDEE